MAGIGHCTCCGGYDDVVRYMGCGKPYGGATGPDTSAGEPRSGPSSDPCSHVYLRVDNTWHFSGWYQTDSTDPATIRTFDYTVRAWRKWDRYTSFYESHEDPTPGEIFPDGYPPFVTHESTLLVDTETKYQSQGKAHVAAINMDGQMTSDFVSIVSERYDFSDHLKDFQKLADKLLFDTILAKMRKDPHYLGTEIGYIDGGTIVSMDSFGLSKPPEFNPPVTDTTGWYCGYLIGDPPQENRYSWLYKLPSLASAIHAFPAQSNFTAFMSVAAISIVPVTAHTNLCHGMHTFSRYCPTQSESVQYTPIDTGSLTALKMGNERGGGANFYEVLYTEGPCPPLP